MQVELTPEIVRIAQNRATRLGVNYADELARVAFEEMIFNLDPGLNYLINQDDCLSSFDCLVASIGVNDVIINELRFDVRAVDENDQITVPRILINSNATLNGSFAVKVDDGYKASLVGYISGAELVGSLNYSEDRKYVIETIESDQAVNLIGIINKVAGKILLPLDKAVTSIPKTEEIFEFCKDPYSFSYERQREILATLCLSKDSHKFLDRLPAGGVDGLSKGVVSKMLRADSRWNRKTDEMAILLEPKFKSLSRSEIKKTLTGLGETYGGEPEAPEFKKSAMKNLTSEHLSRSLGAEKLARVKSIVDQVISGTSLIDAVKARVKNNVAVDLAYEIKKRRGKVESFVQASAEEIGFAFQKLAIQPAYATHSSGDGGVDSINEALEILETCELLEELES